MSDEKRKVYAVSTGSYSDYHIERVFSTRELAQRYIETKYLAYKEAYGDSNYYGSDSGLEEWNVDDDFITTNWEVVWTTNIGFLYLSGPGSADIREPSKTASNELGGERSKVTYSPLLRDGNRWWGAQIYSGVSAEHCHKLAVEALQRLRAEFVLGQPEMGKKRKKKKAGNDKADM